MFQKYAENKRAASDNECMSLAIKAAEAAKSKGEQARGAALSFPNRTIVDGQSVLEENDPTCHAEMNVLRKSAHTHRRALREAVLYCTTEPCAMCVAAAMSCGIREIVFGAYDTKDGFQSTNRLNIEGMDLSIAGGVLSEACFSICSPSLREHLTTEGHR